MRVKYTQTTRLLEEELKGVGREKEGTSLPQQKKREREKSINTDLEN